MTYGRTLWDFLSENKLGSFFAFVILTALIIVLFFAGYRLKPELGILEKPITKEYSGFTDVNTKDKFITLEFEGVTVKEDVVQSLNSDEKRIEISKSASYLIVLNVTVENSSLASEAESDLKYYPYLYCSIEMIDSNSQSKPIFDDNGFSSSCGGSVVETVTSGSTLLIKTKHKGNEELTLKGKISILLVSDV